MRRWNYRVIEFVQSDAEHPNEPPWRAIHEVYYDDQDYPIGYSERPAVIGWTADEGDAVALVILERVRDALKEPVLKTSDFSPKR